MSLANDIKESIITTAPGIYADARWTALADGIASAFMSARPGKEIKATISNATGDATNDITISTCSIYDSTGAYEMILTSALTKKTDADFAAGTDQGGGNLASTAWYHVYVIRKDSDGTIDAYFDTDATASNIPAGYTYYRHVGFIYHSTPAGVTQFFNILDRYYLKTLVQDCSTINPGTNAVLQSVTVPPTMIAIVDIVIVSTHATIASWLITSPSETDSTPSSDLCDIRVNSDSIRGAARREILTDSSSRIRYRTVFSDANTSIKVFTRGWIDTLL
jgi:hypothetical protein